MVVHNLNLNELYGEKFQGRFDVGTRNIFKGTLANKTHHCPECQRQPSRKCWQDLHLAYCIAPTGTGDSKCGERFTVKSPGGCSTHPYNGSGHVNLIFRNAIRGIYHTNDEQQDDTADAAPAEPASILPPVDPNDPQPWCRYSKAPQFKSKPPPQMKTRQKTKKLQPAKNYKDIVKKGDKEK